MVQKIRLSPVAKRKRNLTWLKRKDKKRLFEARSRGPGNDPYPDWTQMDSYESQGAARAPVRQTVLITAGSGFLAAHVLTSILDRGYKTRTTVRSKKTAGGVRETHKNHLDQLSFATVPDVSAPAAFDEAVKGVDGVSIPFRTVSTLLSESQPGHTCGISISAGSRGPCEGSARSCHQRHDVYPTSHSDSRPASPPRNHRTFDCRHGRPKLGRLARAYLYGSRLKSCRLSNSFQIW